MKWHLKNALKWLVYVTFIRPIVNGHSASVKTSKGIVQGYTLDDVSVFEGIPYAKAPIGDQRFQAPIEPDPWPATLETKAFRPICPQMMTPYSAQMNIVGPFSEDCLYLNVYTPIAHAEPARAAALPVMVWIHGGGYIQGSASQTPAPGIVSNLASRRVVVVTFNYRLDILGFFSSGGDDTPDNVALLDQLAALKWVQKEIRNFGGNPRDVTMFGYSAGASSVSAHLYSPMSRGLFTKAIMQSGSAFAPWAWSYSDQDSNTRISIETAKSLGCGETWIKEDWKSVLDCMRTVSVDTLIEASWEAATKLGLGWRLMVGTSEGFLPLAPTHLASERRDNITVMIGTTRDETIFTAAPSVVLDGHAYDNVSRTHFTNALDSLSRAYFQDNERHTVRAMLEYIYGDGERFVELNNSRAWLDSIVQMQSGFSFFAPAILEAQLLLDTQRASVFLYSLDYISDGFPWASPYRGVPHGQDMFYIFATAPNGLGWTFTKEEQRIVDVFGKMWTNFAKSGDPNFPVPLNFTWTPLSEKERWSYLTIDTPMPCMSDVSYHWKADRAYNNLLPRLLSYTHQDRTRISQFDDQPHMARIVELRTNQFFIATWTLLFTLVGVVIVILIFSICHWQSTSADGGGLELVSYSHNGAKLKKARKKRNRESTSNIHYIPPILKIPSRTVYYNNPMFHIRYPELTYDSQSRRMTIPSSRIQSNDSRGPTELEKHKSTKIIV